MAKVTIYLSIVERNGQKHLHLRDSNRICGDESIVTEVSRGDIIVWKRDTESGLKSITGLKFEKSEELFVKSLNKGWCSVWKGLISDKAKGKYPYQISYISCNPGGNETSLKSAAADDSPPPIIKIRD
jgi:hypothetical protein